MREQWYEVQRRVDEDLEILYPFMLVYENDERVGGSADSLTLPLLDDLLQARARGTAEFSDAFLQQRSDAFLCRQRAPPRWEDSSDEDEEYD